MDWKSSQGIQMLNKLIDLKTNNLTYREIAEKLSDEYNVDLTTEQVKSAYFRHLKRSASATKNLNQKDQEILEMNEAIDEEEEWKKSIQEAKEKARKDRDQRLLKKLLKERGTTELILETFTETIKAFDWIDIQPPKPVEVTPEREEALLLFSDAQIGEKILPENTNGFGEYNIEIFKQRMDKLIDEMRHIHYCQSLAYNIDTLNIFMLGDNVDGIGIYRGQDHHLDALVVEQFLVGSEKIAESLIKLLGSFKKINIWGIVGNHGRMGKKGEYPTHINWDYLLYKTLEMLLQNYKDRITWHIPLSNWTLAEVNNQKFLLLHGDTIKAWNGLPYYGIDRADSRLTSMLASKQMFYRYLCMGHHHNPADIDSPAGEKILNGTMVGGSDFSINQLHTTSRPSQWFFGVHHRKGITWRHKILLDD